MATFTAAAQVSSYVLVEPQGSAAYSLDDGAGAFVGNVALELSEYPTFGYVVYRNHTANVSTSYFNDTVKNMYVRLRCTAFSGDLTTYTLSNSDSEVTSIAFQGGEIIDKNGRNVLTATQGGVTVSGTLDADALVFDSAVAEDFTVTDDLSVGGDADVTGTFGVMGQATFDDVQVDGELACFGAVTLDDATASQALFTNGTKVVVSNAITGTGNVVMSASPTLTGTIGAASQTLSGTLGVTGASTLGDVTINGTLTTAASNISEPRSFCTIYKTSSDLISATLGSTPTAITGTFSTEYKSSDFTVTASGGIMTYTGAATKKFWCTGYIIVSSSNPRTVESKFSSDGGSTFLNSIAGASISAGFQFAYPVHFYASLAQNATVQAFLYVTSSTSSISTIQCVISLFEYPTAA